MNTQEAIVLGSTRFLSALIEGKGIQAIIDIGYELLGNPIHFVDASYKVLAYTKNVELDDLNWHKIVESKYLTYDVVSKIDMKEIFYKIKSRKHPVINKPNNLNFEILHSAIIVDDKIAGYLMVPSIIKPFGENVMEIATLLSNVLSLEMQGNKFLRNSKEIMYEYFVADLLDENITDQAVIDERLKCLNWSLQENLYVLTLQKQNDIDNIFLPNLSESIRNIIVGSKSIVYNNYIVMVISRKKKNFPNKSELKYLTEILNTNKMYGGISRCFRSLAKIRKHFKQSLKSIELGANLHKQKVLFTYEEFAIYHLMSICSTQEALKVFCHASLFILTEYDRQYSDQLVPCLYEYLMNNKNMVKASNALGIHRNTMRYRIKKISEIMDLDINNEHVSFHLLFSFMILQFLEIAKSEPLHAE